MHFASDHPLSQGDHSINGKKMTSKQIPDEQKNPVQVGEISLESLGRTIVLHFRIHFIFENLPDSELVFIKLIY